MNSFWLNPLTLEGLYCLELGKAYLYFRNPRRRELRGHRLAFNQRAWREAAQSLGASWSEVGANISEIRLNGHSTRVIDYTCEIDSPVTCALLHEKPLVHKILTQKGLPVPRHACFTLRDIKPAADFLQECKHDCVVKPANGSGAGRGVTTGIRSQRHLARAAASAAVHGDDLLIEEQIPGDNYRLLYLDGKLIDAFIRRPPTVVGDGRSTIAELVHRSNEQRLSERAALSQVLIPIDFDMRRTLSKQGLSLRRVPASGARVILKTVINDNCGHDNSTVLNELHPSIVQAGAQAVAALRVRFAGIDLITTDASVPLAESGGVILEVNGTPGLYCHYHKRDDVFPAALHVLRRLLQEEPSVPSPARGDEANQFEGSLV